MERMSGHTCRICRLDYATCVHDDTGQTEYDYARQCWTVGGIVET